MRFEIPQECSYGELDYGFVAPDVPDHSVAVVVPFSDAAGQYKFPLCLESLAPDQVGFGMGAVLGARCRVYHRAQSYSSRQ